MRRVAIEARRVVWTVLRLEDRKNKAQTEPGAAAWRVCGGLQAMAMLSYLATKYAELQGEAPPVIAGVGLVRTVLVFPHPETCGAPSAVARSARRA